MARLARVVVPGAPHHVTQRGNRHLETFFEDDDYRAYLDLLSAACAEARVAVWAYCLMPNKAAKTGLRKMLFHLCVYCLSATFFGGFTALGISGLDGRQSTATHSREYTFSAAPSSTPRAAAPNSVPKAHIAFQLRPKERLLQPERYSFLWQIESHTRENCTRQSPSLFSTTWGKAAPDDATERAPTLAPVPGSAATSRCAGQGEMAVKRRIARVVA